MYVSSISRREDRERERERAAFMHRGEGTLFSLERDAYIGSNAWETLSAETLTQNTYVQRGRMALRGNPAGSTGTKKQLHSI